MGGLDRCRHVSDHWFGGYQQRSANTAGVRLRAADCDGSSIELVPRLTCPQLTSVGAPIPGMVAVLDQENPARASILSAQTPLHIEYWKWDELAEVLAMYYHQPRTRWILQNGELRR